MREFLYSDIAAIHGLSNIPDDPDLAIKVGERLCQDLLEPLQEVFGRVALRSAYRSSEVNGFGSTQQRLGKAGYPCGSNDYNLAGHIWDRRDKHGFCGANVSVVVPEFIDVFQGTEDWQIIAWWIHDHLPYSSLGFFPVNKAFNLSWHEVPKRIIHSYIRPKGLLTKPGMDNNYVGHRKDWEPLIAHFPKAEGFHM